MLAGVMNGLGMAWAVECVRVVRGTGELATHGEERPPMTPLRALLRGMDGTYSKIEKQWTGEFIMTFLDRKNGGIPFMLDAIDRVADFAHWRAAFDGEESRIDALEDKLAEIRAQGDASDVDAAGLALGGYYNFMAKSWRNFLMRHSCRLSDSPELPEFGAIPVLTNDKFEDLLLRLANYQVREAGVAEHEGFVPFSTYIDEFMNGLVVERHNRFSEVGISASLARGFCQLLGIRAKELKRCADSNEDLRRASAATLDSALHNLSCMESNYQNIARLKKTIEGINADIERENRHVRLVLEACDRSKHPEHFDGGFYGLVREKLFSLFDDSETQVAQPIHADTLEICSHMNCMMKANLIAFLQHARGRGRLSGDRDNRIDADIEFVRGFRSTDLAKLHAVIAEYGSGARRRMESVIARAARCPAAPAETSV